MEQPGIMVEFTGDQVLGGAGPKRNVTTLLSNEMRNIGKMAAGLDFEPGKTYSLFVAIGEVPQEAVPQEETPMPQEGEALFGD